MKKVKLMDICEPKQWKTIPISELSQSGYPLYGANGKIGFYKEYTHEKPTLMVTCRGATCGQMHISEPRSYINGNAMAFDNIDEKEMNIKYLFYLFRKRGFKDCISGSAQPQITRQGLEKVTIEIHEKDEQDRIVTVLDRADSLRQKRKEQIKLLDDFLKSKFLEMFGDPVRNEKGWNVVQIRDVADVRIGPFGSLLHKEDYVSHGIPLVNPTHIVDNKIAAGVNLTITKSKLSQLEVYKLKAGDVVLGRRGEIGRCAVVTEKEDGYLCGTGSMFVRPGKSLNQVFLGYLLSSESVKSSLENKAIGITMKNLNAGIVKKFGIILPDWSLQNKFAKIVLLKEGIKVDIVKGKEEIEKHFSALMQEYFR